MYSALGYPCSNTERIVSSINCPWLYDGVTILIRGQGRPSGIVSGNCGLSSVHGQPVLPGGGGESSIRVGQRIRLPVLLPERSKSSHPGHGRIRGMRLNGYEQILSILETAPTREGK